jgi:SAM-dependent methyltransferase
MNTAESDKLFSGSIPKLYDDYLVPLIFQPYAQDLVGRLASRKPARVLEIAAGTGVVTRLLASTLPASAAIVATDLNRPMLELAAAVGTSRPVQWREADAMQLPFGDGEFPTSPRRLPKRTGSSSQAASCCSTPGTGSRRTSSPTP